MAERAYTYGEEAYYSRYRTGDNLAYDNSAPAIEEQEIVRRHKKTSILDNPKKLLAITFVMVIAGVFIILLRSSIITNMNTEVSTLNSKLGVYHSKNEQTAVMLDRTTDLKYVENVAREKLNMDIPRTDQKVYLDVNIPDSVEVPAVQGNAFLNGVKKFINNCLEYLY